MPCGKGDKMAEKEKKVSRGMPNNVDAEASVLGSILIDNRAADELIPTLKATDFYLSQNRTIFSVMKELQNESKPIDTVSVADALEIKGELDSIGSIAYLSELAEGVPSAANGEYYAHIVKRDSLTRRVIEAGNDIAKFGYECAEGTEALDNAEKLVYQIAEDNSEKALLKADDALAEAIKNIQDVQTGNVPKNMVYTDFPTFDSKTHGLKPGEMVLIAARPSVGKTAFALNIAANVCLNHGKNVAIFSLEMPSYLLTKRMLAYVSKVSISKMDTRGGMTAADNAKLFKAYNALLAAGLYIDDYSMNSPSDILSKCRRLKREKGLDLVIIDYLQLMTGGKSGRNAPESRQVEVSDMSRKMKIYAKELDVPIVLLSQMSRGVEQRTDHTPMLSDLRESGSIEQDADIVAFLNNPSKYNAALPENQVILDVKKNRNGPIGEITLEWNGDTTSFKEYVDSDANVPVQQNSHIADAAPVEDEPKIVADTADMPFAEAAADQLAKTTAVFSEEDKEDGNLPYDDMPTLSDDDIPQADDDDEYVDEGDELPFD